LLNFSAIGIKYTIAKIDVRRGAGLDHQDLVGTDAKTSVAYEAALIGAQLYGLTDGIDDDKVISSAMHFGEFEFHAAIISRETVLNGKLLCNSCLHMKVAKPDMPTAADKTTEMLKTMT
jgi:hypothetical protein